MNKVSLKLAKCDLRKIIIGNHFITYLNQIIILYNLYSDICQLFLIKTERKEK